MTPDQDNLEALLADYVDGSLTGEELAAAEAQLAADPKLRALVAQMRGDSESLRRLPRVTAPVDLSEDLRGQIERDLLLTDPLLSARRSLPMFSAPVAAVAAMLVVGLSVAGVAYWILGNRPAPFTEVAMKDVPTTATAAKEAAAPGEEAKLSASPTTVASAALPVELPARREERETAAGARVITLDVPRLEDVAATPVPPDVEAALAQQPMNARRRSVVFVVDASEPIAFNQQVASLLTSRGGVGGALADSRRFDALHDTERRAAIAGEADPAGARVLSNSVPPTPTAEALAEPAAVLVARGLTEEAAAQLQAEVKQSAALAGTASVASYEPPRRPYANGGPIYLSKSMPAAADAGSSTTAPAGLLAQTTGPTTAPATTAPIDRAFQRGDRLRVTLTDPDASNLTTQHDVTVSGEGTVALPSIDVGITAADRSEAQLASDIASEYRRFGLIRRPSVRVEALDVPAFASDMSTVLADQQQQMATAAPMQQALGQPMEQMGQQMAQQMEQSPAAATMPAGDGPIDVYVVVRDARAATRPAATQPATQPQ